MEHRIRLTCLLCFTLFSKSLMLNVVTYLHFRSFHCLVLLLRSVFAFVTLPFPKCLLTFLSCLPFCLIFAYFSFQPHFYLRPIKVCPLSVSILLVLHIMKWNDFFKQSCSDLYSVLIFRTQYNMERNRCVQTFVVHYQVLYYWEIQFRALH